MFRTSRQALTSLLPLAALVLSVASATAAAPPRPAAPPTAQAKAPAQRTFAKAEDAVNALLTAMKSDDEAALRAIFGPESEDVLSSGDPVADRNGRRVIAIAFQRTWSLSDLDETTKEIVIGREEWPFPIPLVLENGAWRFDTAAGKDEILARRIGRNELSTLRHCQTYVIAQREYAEAAHDGRPAGAFAQKFISDQDTQNGLYWPPTADAPLSPLGPLFTEATSEGYAIGQAERPRAFHGYVYRILTAQGPGAPGGARNYIVKGDMTGGFALIAWPADYRNSGIMTFILNQDGVIYEKDLGENTTRLVGEIKAFNPDESWTKVELESEPEAEAQPEQQPQRIPQPDR
jgi:hypothetical protein